MADKVKPLKIENPATGGTDTDMTPREMNPSQDYAALKGIAFENSDTLIIETQSGEIGWIDSAQPTFKTLNSLDDDQFSYHKIELDQKVTIQENQHMICLNLEIDGFLIIDGGLIIL